MDNPKLKALAKEEGRSITELLKEGTYDSICMGICTNPDCNYTTQVEPDQDKGYCEVCNTQSVSSCLVLAGII